MAREDALEKRLAAMEQRRKKLRRQLQLVRMRAAGKRRKSNNKLYRAVGKLLEKEDPALFEKMSGRISAPAKPRRGRRARKSAE